MVVMVFMMCFKCHKITSLCSFMLDSKNTEMKPGGSTPHRLDPKSSCGLSERILHTARALTHQEQESGLYKRHEPKRMQFKGHREPVGQGQASHQSSGIPRVGTPK